LFVKERPLLKKNALPFCAFARLHDDGCIRGQTPVVAKRNEYIIVNVLCSSNPLIYIEVTKISHKGFEYSTQTQ
jgi:hypothetical protein